LHSLQNDRGDEILPFDLVPFDYAQDKLSTHQRPLGTGFTKEGDGGGVRSHKYQVTSIKPNPTPISFVTLRMTGGRILTVVALPQNGHICPE
jgi:hypothetical protein